MPLLVNWCSWAARFILFAKIYTVKIWEDAVADSQTIHPEPSAHA